VCVTPLRLCLWEAPVAVTTHQQSWCTADFVRAAALLALFYAADATVVNALPALFCSPPQKYATGTMMLGTTSVDCLPCIVLSAGASMSDTCTPELQLRLHLPGPLVPVIQATLL
jgi:hypothetical protein